MNSKKLTEDDYLNEWFEWGEEIELKEEYSPEELIAYKASGKLIPLVAFPGDFRFDIEKRQISPYNPNNDKFYYRICGNLSCYDKLALVGFKTSPDPEMLVLMEQYHLQETQDLGICRGYYPMTLDTTNTPLYRASKYLNLSDENDELVLSKVIHYVKFYFNNVSGRHGKFYIVDGTNISGYLDFDYVLNFQHGNEKPLKFSQDSNLWKSFDHEIFNNEKVEFPKAIEPELEIYPSKLKRVDEEFIQLESVIMIFKTSVFQVDIQIGYYKDRTAGHEEKSLDGVITLSNEILIAETKEKL